MRDQLITHLRRALEAVGLPEPSGGIELEPPKQAEHGDWTTNLALKVAGPAQRKPRDVAEELAVALRADPPPHLADVQVAGPGFLNVFLAPTWLHEVLRLVVAAGEGYGHGDALHGQRICREVTNLPLLPANGELLTWKRTWIVGGSTSIRGSATGLLGSAIVSPIATSSMPARPTMSPAPRDVDASAGRGPRSRTAGRPWRSPGRSRACA